MKDVLGVTSIDDLCESDVKKVRALALIELTALFDTNNITYSRRKPKKRLKGKGCLAHIVFDVFLVFSPKYNMNFQISFSCFGTFDAFRPWCLWCSIANFT